MKKSLPLIGLFTWLMLMASYQSVNAQCLVAPFTETFDNTTAPNCWSTSQTSGGPWVFGTPGFTWNQTGCSGVPTDHTGNGGNYAAMDHSLTDAGVILEIDTVDVSALTTPYLEFYFYMCTANYSPPNMLFVESYDGSNWNRVDSIASGSASWEEFGYDLTGHTFGSNFVKIRFRAESGGSGDDFYGDNAIDDVSIKEMPTCFKTSALMAANISSTTADVSWTDPNSAANFLVEYGVSGFALGSGTQASSTTTMITLSGLMPNTNYQYYVRAVCAAGDSSDWTVAQFTTGCAAFTAPYFNDFESDALDQEPNCWSSYVSYSGGFVEVEDFTGSGAPFAGSQALYIYSSSGFTQGSDTLIGVGPQFSDMTAGDKQIRFQANSDLPSQMIIGTIDVPTTAGVFTPLDTTTFAVADTYEEVVVQLTTTNGYNGTDEYIAFVHDLGSTFDYIRIDNFNYEVIPSCPSPSALTLVTPFADSATLGWTENGSATQWQIEWGPAGFSQGNGTLVLANSNPATISGLTGNTNYEWYVRAICAPGDSSTWSSVSSFTTLCSAFSVGYTEDFSTYLPTCWDEAQGQLTNNTVFTSTTTSNWVADGFLNVGTTGAARMNIFSTNRFEWLISPPLDLGSGGSSYQVEFDAGLTDFSGTGNDQMGADDTLAVVISTDNGQTWSRANTLTSWYAGLQPSNNGERVILSLAPYTGLVRIGFYATSTVSNTDYNVYIDNFELAPLASCPQPSALMASNITDSSATLGWTENGTATTWEIEYDTAGFTQGSGRNTAVVTANPTTINGLMDNQAYDWYVRAICAPMDSSLVTGPASFVTPCAPVMAPFSEDFSGGNSIPACWEQGASNSENWIFATSGGHVGNNGTISGSTPSGGTFAYVDDSSPHNSNTVLLTPFIDLSALFTPRLTFYTISDNEGDSNVDFHVDIYDGSKWIDSVFFADTNSLNAAWEKITIDINSAITVSGPIRVRFVVDEVNGGDFDDDRAIDDIVIEETPLCQEPTLLGQNNIGPDSAIVGWTDPNGASEWEISYGPVGFTAGSGTQVLTTSNPDTLRGLTIATPYDWYVRAICGRGDTSNYSLMSSFFTPCPNPTVVATLPFIEGWENSNGTALDNAVVSCATDHVWNFSTSDPEGRVRWGTDAEDVSTGSGAVTLDRDPSGGVTVNDLILTLNMSAQTSATDLELLFDFRHHGEEEHDNDSVWIRGSDSDPWVGVYDLFANQLTTFQTVGPFDIDALLSAAGQTVSATFQLRLGQEDNFPTPSDGYTFDNITIRTTPSCFAPTALGNSNIGQDSAILAWTENNSATQWEISYGPAGFIAGSGTQFLTNSNPDTLRGLMASTSYDWYVRSICGVGDSSAWSTVDNFVTLCAPFTAPYTMNFDAFPTAADFNNAGVPCWTAIGPGANDVELTSVTDAAVSSPIPTAPNAVEFNDGQWPADTSMLVSPQFSDLSSGLNRIRFQAAFESASPADVTLFIGVMTDPTNTSTFVPLDTIDANDVGGGTAFGEVIVNLNNTSLIGSAEYIAIAHGPGFFEAYVDSFVYEAGPPDDLGLSAIVRPTSGCTVGDSIEVTIENFGTVNQSNFQLGYAVNGVAITPETFTGTIAPGATANYTFTTTASLSGVGTYDIDAYTLLPTDFNNLNDSGFVQVVNFPNVSTFPYSESFESGNGGWSSAGVNNSWALGVPAGTVINSAADGTQAWVTNLSGDYGAGEVAFVISPCFDFTNIADPYIELSIWRESESSWDGAVLQYTIDGGTTWQNVGAFGDTVNWYNDDDVDALLGNGISSSLDGWSGSSGGWLDAAHYLNNLGGQASVQLRVAFSSDGTVFDEGFAFDDIEIYDNPPPAPYYAIGVINGEDATSGVADSLGVECQISGTVVGIDRRGGNGYDFTLIDQSSGQQEGIVVFNFSDVNGYVVTESDSINVWGDVSQFNGLTQFSPDSIEVISTGHALPTPISVSTLDETTEAKYIRIDTLVVVVASGNAGSSYNMTLSKGGNQLTMRIDSDTDIDDTLGLPNGGLLVGDTVCSVIGLGGQFDNSNPFTSGYQILPSYFADIDTVSCQIVGINDVEAVRAELSVYPNPNKGAFTLKVNGLEQGETALTVRDVRGTAVYQEQLRPQAGGLIREINLEGVSKGIYFVTLRNGEQLYHQKIIVQ